jgi:hypothetical protein
VVPEHDLDPDVVASTPPARLPESEPDAPPPPSSLPDADTETAADLPPNSQSSTKENDAPAPSSNNDGAASLYPPPFEVSDSQRTEANTDNTEDMPPPPSQQPAPTDPDDLTVALPPELLTMYQSSIRALQYEFAHSPPYTVQRLAELTLRPKRHYRFLPAFLRALDRIVSVSSSVSEFPLPPPNPPVNGFLSNGESPANSSSSSSSERHGLGSDEALGGALLTPIPWLRNQGNVLTPSSAASSQEPGAGGELHRESTETIDGPHGAGRIETVSVTVNGISSAASQQQQQPSSSPIVSPTLSEQSDASTSSDLSSTDAQLREQGGVTQGELLRQEQEAGVVPVVPAGHSMTLRRPSHHHNAVASRESTSAAAARSSSSTTSPPVDQVMEDPPHARGPEEIGMEDMGPQPAAPPPGATSTLDMEAAVGRGRSVSPHPAEPGPDTTTTASDAVAIAAADQMDESGGEAPTSEVGPEDLEDAMEQDPLKKDLAEDSDGSFVVVPAGGKSPSAGEAGAGE